MKKNNKEPLIRISKRNDLNIYQRMLVRVICIAAALVLSILYLYIISGKNPFIAIKYIIEGSAYNPKNNGKKFWAFIQEGTILLGIAIALVPAYKMKFWNVGAQGQLLMGALMTAICMIYLNFLPSWLVIIFSLLLSLIGGAIWGFIPAFFKARWNTNETLFTLMMNYIAIQIVMFCTENWRGDNSSMKIINMSTEVGWLPQIAKIKTLLPLIIVIILMVAMYFYIKKSKHGYEIQVIGESVNTARYAGIKVRRTIVRTMILSGALCGLIGFFYVAGFDHTISSTTSNSYGFTAIIICWLSNFNPFIMPIFAYLLSFLSKGASNLQNSSVSPSWNTYSCETIVLLIFISIMISEFFIRYNLVFKKKIKSTELKEEAK